MNRVDFLNFLLYVRENVNKFECVEGQPAQYSPYVNELLENTHMDPITIMISIAGKEDVSGQVFEIFDSGVVMGELDHELDEKNNVIRETRFKDVLSMQLIVFDKIIAVEFEY